MKLLHHDPNATDPLYNNIQEDSLFRDRCESLYETCHKLVDKKFPSQIKHAFAPCYSELYFCTTFIKRLGMRVTHPSDDEGPDNYLESLDCWAEIATISNGDTGNPNTISKPELGIWRDAFADEDKIILRVTNCFIRKANKILYEDIAKGIIKSSQRIIICISGGWIEPFFRLPFCLEGSFPPIVKALLPIGNMVLIMNREKKTVDEVTSQYRGHVTKKKQNKDGEDIRTNYFIDPKYACISGVLFSYSNIYDSIEVADFGRDFFMIHNPLATNPLPKGSFKCGIEYLSHYQYPLLRINPIKHENKS